MARSFGTYARVSAGRFRCQKSAGRRSREGEAAARKRAIVETAMPLFARKGFTRTTTKELAEQAGVSEALLYRHFPTKAALYEAIQQLGCQVDPALEELNALAPSTATLTEMVQAMFQHVVFGAFDDPGTSKIRQRLILQSLLEDGEYARLLLSRVAENHFVHRW